MNTKGLLAHYEQVADAPDAIVRLRRFVLDLAVRGKLVLRADQWITTGIEECLEPLNDGRLIHQGWSPQCESQPSPNENIWGVLKTTAIQDGYFLEEQNKELPGKHNPKPVLEVREGDILITCAGPRARCGIACLVRKTRKRLLISGKMYRFRAKAGVISGDYLALWLRADEAQAAINALKTGSSESGLNLTQDRFRTLQVSFGNIDEQHRIVARVNELMSLCDRLEASRMERELARDQLAVASFARLNTPEMVATRPSASASNPLPKELTRTAAPTTASSPTREADGSFADHARFVLDALPALTVRPDQIKSLRNAILSLAVRGKLVPQDLNDECAPKLLKRIAQSKIDRKKKTGDARIKIEEDPKPSELEMILPSGWAVQSFENLFLFIDYRGNTPPKTDSGIPLITAKNIRMGYLSQDPREYITKSTFDAWMTRGIPKIDDLFFTTEAPLGNICVNNIDEPFALAQRAICFQPYGEINTKFIMYAVMSDLMQSLIDKHATGMTAKGIKAAKLKPLPIPIPPLAEQHRIVTKVDELMAICDKLEASLTTAAGTRRRLLDALIAEALAPDEDRLLEAAE